jgi:hypothetical protein
VTRPIHDTQQDVELDTSKRDVLIGSGHAPRTKSTNG